MLLMMRSPTILAADALLPSRIQMAFTLAYHVIMVPLGVAFPPYALLMNGIGIFKKDPVALRIARRWSVVMAVRVAGGGLTRTVLSFAVRHLWGRVLGRLCAAHCLGLCLVVLGFFHVGQLIRIQLD